MRSLMTMALVVFGLAICNQGYAGPPPAYDADLAKQLGADDYGMRHYVMAFLKTGPKRSESREAAQALMTAHLANIHRLAQTGKLVLAGPFTGKGDLQGLYLFDVKTVEEARRLTASDPAVKAGVFVMELRPWYGSAALMQVGPLSERITKKTF